MADYQQQKSSWQKKKTKQNQTIERKEAKIKKTNMKRFVQTMRKKNDETKRNIKINIVEIPA